MGLIFPFQTTGQELLCIHTWSELEPMIATGEVYPPPREEIHRQILKEAQELLSAMIYGLEFSYTPSDSLRDIPESFQLKPIARLKWGDSHLKIACLEERNKKLFAKLYYVMQDFQVARRQAWSSNTIPVAAGSGESSLLKGPQEKWRSVQEAIKNAIRNHLRPVLFNKPRQVTGEVLIWEAPQTIIKAGNYLTRVTVKLLINKVQSYRIF